MNRRAKEEQFEDDARGAEVLEPIKALRSVSWLPTWQAKMPTLSLVLTPVASELYGYLPGLNGYLEMQQLRARMSLAQIFQAATTITRELKLDLQLGTIEAGKLPISFC